MRLLAQLAAIAVLIGGATMIFFVLVWTKPEAAQRPASEREWIVDTVSVKKTDVRPKLRLSGRITAARDAELRPLAEGRVIEIGPNFYAGGEVREGDLLVQIDPFQYAAERDDAEAALAEAQASLTETEAELASNTALVRFDREQETLRKRDLDRKSKLKGKGVVAETTLDEARIAYLAARETRVTRGQTIKRLEAQIGRLQASVKRAEVRLARAERSLVETRLVAPFDGVLVDVSVTIGKRVGANDAVARIVDSERLEALFHMSDAQFGRLAMAGGVKGRPAEIIWRAGDTAVRMSATLGRTQGEFDAASGGVWIYAPIRANQNTVGLRPGAFVEAETPDIEYANAARLPEEAVYEASRTYVLEAGRLQEREVAVLAREGGDVIVAGDLNDGDLVVSTRLPGIGPGVKARQRDVAQ